MIIFLIIMLGHLMAIYTRVLEGRGASSEHDHYSEYLYRALNLFRLSVLVLSSEHSTCFFSRFLT